MKGRLRVVRRWKKPVRAAKSPTAPLPRPADLDNPYGPCYTRARSFEELRPGFAPKK